MPLLRNRRGPGGTQYRMRERMFSIGDDYWIETAATRSTSRGGADVEAKGNIVDYEFKFERWGDTVAEISKRWFRVRDTYGIEVAPGQDDALILAIAVCIDQMGRPG
jgi:uncharacterized protein YxjI